MWIRQYQILTSVLGVISISVFGVCIWVIADPFDIPVTDVLEVQYIPTLNQYEVMGHSPKLGIAAGMLIMFISALHCLINLKNRKVLTLGIVLIFSSVILILATMGVAISDFINLNTFMDLVKTNRLTLSRKWDDFLEDLHIRLAAVIAASVMTSLFDIIVLIVGILIWTEVIETEI